MTQQQGVSQKERQRRAQQSQAAQNGVDPALSVGMKIAGIELSPEEIASAQSTAEAVNLDELVIPTVRLKWVAWVDDPEHPGMRKPVVEDRVVYAYVPTEIQIKAMESSKGLAKKSPAETMEIMSDLIAEVWKLSDASMTGERVRQGLGGPDRIAKLFQVFFGQVGRRPTSNP